MSVNNEEEEIWKDIPGYEGIYQISTEGRIKRLPCDRLQRNQYKSYVQHYDERILTLSPDNEGYCQVGLTDGNGVMRQYKVHRLVMQTFSPDWDPDKEVDHIFGVKHDNRLSQLRMVTQEENRYHFWHDEVFETERQEKFYHKEFSEETRAKISEKNRNRKGWKWVHKGENVVKIVPPEELQSYLDKGYEEGMGEFQAKKVRKRYSQTKYKYIKKGKITKQVPENQANNYLQDGWQLGNLTKEERNNECK